MDARFSWVDLSTFDVGKAADFYQRVFGWNFSEASGYTQCAVGGTPFAGLYEMPPFFQKINMPSFWMTYVSVDDVKEAVAKAKDLGGKVELEEEHTLGRIALIRDPAGAGFTCYEGGAASRDSSRRGGWCWTELMVSDVGLVSDFYAGLFDWQFEKESDDRYAIRTSGGAKIGAVQVASEDVKGVKEFWAVYFAAPDLDAVAAAIEQAGGLIEGSYPHEHGTQLLAYDDQGAAFFVLQGKVPAASLEDASPAEWPSGKVKWRSLVGLIAVYLIVLFEQHWGWGLLFLFWVLPDLKSGTTYFIEPLSRRSNPFLYWAVVLTWLALSILLLLGVGTS